MQFLPSPTAGIRRLRTGCIGAAIAGAFGLASGATLYDPALGSLPSAQGWLTSGTPGFTQGVSSGLYRLDTTAADAVMAGSALDSLPSLDTVGGFTLDFGLQVVSESHARFERGGFSVIVTGTDPSHALELAFWGDRVFAYTSSFAHGAEAITNTAALTAYSLVVAANQYSFYGNGGLLLAGSLIDYSGFGTPYNRAGLLFFGDDTSSAQSSVNLGRIAVTAAVPEPASRALLMTGIVGLLWVVRRRRVG